jgi:hypothetical protein
MKPIEDVLHNLFMSQQFMEWWDGPMKNYAGGELHAPSEEDIKNDIKRMVESRQK